MVTALDSTLFFLINGHHFTAADWFFLTVTQLGNGWFIGPVLIGIVLYKLPRNYRTRAILCGAVALLFSGTVNSRIKRIVGRPRPYVHFAQGKDAAARSVTDGKTVEANGTDIGKTVRLLGPKYRNRSFPSGHTNTAFSAAALLAFFFGGWWCWSYLAAVPVAYSRVYLGVHYPTDVVAGALTGVLLTLAVLYLCRYLKLISLPRWNNGQ